MKFSKKLSQFPKKPARSTKFPKSVLATQGENVAASYLKKQGLTILYMNWTCFVGEIDIIAHCNEYLIFVEVKTRKSQEMGHPLEAITAKKQYQIIRCSKIFLQNFYNESLSPRFDVISILYENREPNIEWIQGAFGEDGC